MKFRIFVTTEMDGAVMNENLCDEKVMELQGKIMVIEEEIKTLSVQIGGTHDSEEKKLLLKREILLREEKRQLIERGNRLIAREKPLEKPASTARRRYRSQPSTRLCQLVLVALS